MDSQDTTSFVSVAAVERAENPPAASSKFSPQGVYGLLIGIDHYLPNPFCESLQGAVADANAMEELLLSRGVPPANLVKLTASRGRSGSLVEESDRRPTYGLIVEAIQNLGKAAVEHRGELFVHFSGHGCRTQTLIPGTKGTAGLDEGLLPYDIGDSNARIFHDVELSYLLARLGERGVATTLILDACHSGGMLRSAEGVIARGARRTDSSSRPLASGLASLSTLENSWRRAHHRILLSSEIRNRSSIARGSTSIIGWTVPSGALIAACRGREAAYELPVEGESRGALTYALLAALRDSDDRGHSWERIRRSVARIIRRFGLYQTPVFEGRPSAILVGRSHRDEEQTLRVIDVDQTSSRVLLDAGEALGIGRGARVEICALRLGSLTAEIVESESSCAWAQLSDAEVAAVSTGDRAFLIDPKPSLRHRVQVVANESSRLFRKRPIPHSQGFLPSALLRDGCPLIPSAADPTQWLNDIENALDRVSNRFVERVPPGPLEAISAPEFRVTVGSDGSYEILRPDGCAFPNLPPISATSPGAASRLVELLVHLARFRTVRELENRDKSSLLSGSLAVLVGRLAPGFELGDDIVPETCSEIIPRFFSGDRVCLRIINGSLQRLHLFVLALGPDWSVRLLHPRSGLESLSAGQELLLPLRLALPKGTDEGLQTFKIVATLKPTNVRWLELPSAFRSSASTWARRSVPTGQVETFFAEQLAIAGPDRGVPSKRAGRSWITEQVDVEILRSRSR